MSFAADRRRDPQPLSIQQRHRFQCGAAGLVRGLQVRLSGSTPAATKETRLAAVFGMRKTVPLLVVEGDAAHGGDLLD